MPSIPADLRLRPALSCARPEPGTLQLGISQRHGVLLRGLTEEDVRAVTLLRRGRPHPGRGPAPTPRTRQLIGLLGEAGLLSRAPTEDRDRVPPRLVPDAEVWSLVHDTPDDGAALLAARRARHVAVAGTGRLGGAVAATLAAAGVGRVGLLDTVRTAPGDLGPLAAGPGWLGRLRRDAVAEKVREAGAAADSAERLVPGTDRPDLVVLVESGAADAAAADELLSADVPHLSVVAREAEVLVGPLVVPGAGPCLRCLDMHRGDRDPTWPRSLRQLLAARPGGTRRVEETALSTLAAGLAAVQALTQLDGLARPAALGATLEVELPQGLVARRPWPVHPRCGCTAAF